MPARSSKCTFVCVSGCVCVVFSVLYFSAWLHLRPDIPTQRWEVRRSISGGTSGCIHTT